MSIDQLPELKSHSMHQQYISRSCKTSLNEHTPRRPRNAPVFNVNNNVNLQFDIHTNNRGSTSEQEDDEETNVHQENINRGLT